MKQAVKTDSPRKNKALKLSQSLGSAIITTTLLLPSYSIANSDSALHIAEASGTTTTLTLATDPCVAQGGFTDSDLDLISDIVEGDGDPDQDGIPNYLDPDSDGDGLSDLWERKWGTGSNVWDIDRDGLTSNADVNDNDRDVACIVELIDPADKDNNGVFDFLEPPVYFTEATDPCTAMGGGTDTDGDHIIDWIETDADTDLDGIPNYYDHDSDNDGILDIDEFSPLNRGNGDIDRDGIISRYDVDDGNYQNACIKLYFTAADLNNNGTPDYLDSDSDKDGLLDGEEIAYNGVFTADTDRDGIIDRIELAFGYDPANKDTDGGGALDGWEYFLGSDPSNGSDDSTLPQDLDIDNDGIADTLERNTNGVLSADRDADGRTDTQEAGLPDTNNDGFVDDQTDENANGIPDIGEALTVLPDFDGDSVPDMLDPDSDQDGVADKYEFNHYQLPEGYAANPNDVDGDGLLNLHDLDSDNDGIFDIVEMGRTQYLRLTNDGNRVEAVRDTNNDGIIDDMQDIDSDGIPDSIDHSFLPNEPDSDQDGIVDFADADNVQPTTSTQTDAYGYSTTSTTVVDGDNNGIYDFVQPDNNLDGGFDPLMQYSLELIDNDQDGIPAILDNDDNNAYSQSTAPNPEQTAPIELQQPEIQAASPAKSGGGSISLWLFLSLGLLRLLTIRSHLIK